MKTVKDGMGIGMMKLPIEETEVYGYGGGIDGFSSIAGHFPEEKITVAFISNAANYPMKNLFLGAMKITLWQEYELPGFSPTVTLQPEALEKIPGHLQQPRFSYEDHTLPGEGTLIAQATGQSPVPPRCRRGGYFNAERLMLKLTFFPAEDKMLLEQGVKFSGAN